MENELEILNRILFLDFRPWKLEQENDSKFKMLLSATNKEYYKIQPLFDITFPKPMSNIRKYYARLIENDAIRFLNRFHTEFEKAINRNEKTYLIHYALTRKLFQKLEELNQIIEQRGYSTSQFILDRKHEEIEISISNESYIFHLLKHHLVRLVLEIQLAYSDFLNEEQLNEEEIYFRFFNEPAPAPSCIGKAENFPNVKQPTQNIMKVEAPVFNAIKGDFREATKKVLLYEQVIKNASRFAMVEEELFRNGYIDENYKFRNKHGQKQFLAAFYHQLIRKNYFNKLAFPGKKEIIGVSIRKFLDYRYQADVDKQFRNWDNDKQALTIFIEKDYFLDHILAC